MSRALVAVLAMGLIWATGTRARAAEVLVEAESFADPGGWVVDQQFMDTMGSPYLLAHGMGAPVAPAKTTVAFAEAGTYRLWVRTKDWIPEHHPGRFTIAINGQPLPGVFGTEGKGWLWQDGGKVAIRAGEVAIQLNDLTGFEGRCDALYFTTDAAAKPPADPGPAMDTWRRRLLGLPEVPPSAGEFDVVVVGGGIAGTGAAVAAARMGSRVAFVHDRPWLGGNASQEVRVHTGGQTGNTIIPEIDAPYNASAGLTPHPTIKFDDERHRVVEAEKNIALFLSMHVFRVQKDGDRILSVDGKHIVTGKELRFAAPSFIDCTGDGSVGAWAGAEYRVGREAKDEHNESIAPDKADKMVLGTSLMWGSVEGEEPSTFPEVPWGKEVAKDIAAVEGDWTWEYGHYLDTITDAEEIRDYLFRAIYGAYSNAKNGSNQAKYAKRRLSHVPFVAGKRENRRLIGDHILTQEDVQTARAFPDAVATGSWSIDLHFPKDYDKYPFRTYAQFNKVRPYPIPYRCLYSKNISNLLMAGRNMSVTHVALGTVRVMNTGGQMGVAAGAAAALCAKHKTTPRGIYEKHLDELLAALAGTGDYAGVLRRGGDPRDSDRLLAPPGEPNAVRGLKVSALAEGSPRCSEKYVVAALPKEYAGLPCVTIDRGNHNVPSPGFAFMVDQPVTVILAVHDRGNAGLPEGWEKIEGKLTWKAGEGQSLSDSLYRKSFAAGKVEIPAHAGREGGNFGLPHMAIIQGPKDVKVTAAP
jgi:hypothetical protein